MMTYTEWKMTASEYDVRNVGAGAWDFGTDTLQFFFMAEDYGFDPETYTEE